MKLQDLKAAIDTFGRNNCGADTVIEVKNGEIELKNTDNFMANQVSLMDCVFDFSRNFNDTAIEALLPELNSMIETSKTQGILELWK
jgi:hypothetical protein